MNGRQAVAVLYISIAAGAAALAFAAILAMNIVRQDEGSEAIRAIGEAIREGAMAFLRREYTLLALFVVIVWVILAVFIDWDVLDKIDGPPRGVPSTAFAYLGGAIGSALAGFIGMNIAVRANTRTTVKAMAGLNPALRVSFNSGAVMGVSVVGLGLLGITLAYWVIKDINIVAGFGFGASSIALFARVGGGIYTKAADVGADLVGKVEAGIPEDDPRNPATIADNVGDNVGDVAGMGADLFESYVGSIIAAIALAAVGVTALGMVEHADLPFDHNLVLAADLVAATGVFASILGTFLVRTGEQADMGRLLWALRIGIFAAGALVLVGIGVAITQMDLPFEPVLGHSSGPSGRADHRHVVRGVHVVRVQVHT